MKDYRYIARVGSLYMNFDGSMKNDRDKCDRFESETEPTQIFNQLKRDGELDKNAKLKLEKVEEASNAATRRYAKARHDRTGVTRKHSGEPYFVHPDSVAKLVQAYGGTEAQIQAAYLHDTMEDTGETADHIAELFGDEVASIVSEITNDPWEVRRLGKENYISKELCELSHEALLVKLCDIYYNQMDYPKPEQAQRQINNIDYLLSHREDLTDTEIDIIEAILQVSDL